MILNWISGGNWYHTKISDKLDIAIHSSFEYVPELNNNGYVWTVFINGKELPKKYRNSKVAMAQIKTMLIKALEEYYFVNEDEEGEENENKNI